MFERNGKERRKRKTETRGKFMQATDMRPKKKLSMRRCTQDKGDEEERKRGDVMTESIVSTEHFVSFQAAVCSRIFGVCWHRMCDRCNDWQHSIEDDRKQKRANAHMFL